MIHSLLFLPLFGCLKTVHIESNPRGAVLYEGGATIGVTPLDVKVWNLPFYDRPVRVGLEGFRSVSFPLANGLGLWRLETTHQLILVPVHGLSGTWDPAEVQRAQRD